MWSAKVIWLLTNFMITLYSLYLTNQTFEWKASHHHGMDQTLICMMKHIQWLPWLPIEYINCSMVTPSYNYPVSLSINHLLWVGFLWYTCWEISNEIPSLDIIQQKSISGVIDHILASLMGCCGTPTIQQLSASPFVLGGVGHCCTWHVWVHSSLNDYSVPCISIWISVLSNIWHPYRNTSILMSSVATVWTDVFVKT